MKVFGGLDNFLKQQVRLVLFVLVYYAYYSIILYFLIQYNKQLNFHNYVFGVFGF